MDTEYVNDMLDSMRALIELAVWSEDVDCIIRWRAAFEFGMVLQACMQAPPEKYRSFVLLVASACFRDKEGLVWSGTWADTSPALNREGHEQHREEFHALVHLIWTKVALFKKLQSHANVYRVAFVSFNTSNSGLLPLCSVLFCAAFQNCLAGYVCAQVWPILAGDPFEINARFLLAICFLLLTVLLTRISISTFLDLGDRGLWAKSSLSVPFWLLDGLTSVVLPILVMATGFILICNSQSSSEGVLSSAALLLILKLHDLLPNLLDLPDADLIKNFISVSTVAELRDFFAQKKNRKLDIHPVKFRSILDMKLGGQKVEEAIALQFDVGSTGLVHISNSTFVTKGCLFRRIDFLLVEGYRESAIIPWLRLWRLEGDQPLVLAAYTRFAELGLEPYDAESGDDLQTNFWPTVAKISTDQELSCAHSRKSIRGAMLITSLKSDVWITDLRVCWAEVGQDMINSLDYCGIFSCDVGARAQLKRHRMLQESTEFEDTKEVSDAPVTPPISPSSISTEMTP